MKFLHIVRVHEIPEEGLETVTAEAVWIGTRTLGLSVRWRSVEDGRPCLCVGMNLAGYQFDIVNRPSKR